MLSKHRRISQKTFAALGGKGFLFHSKNLTLKVFKPKKQEEKETTFAVVVSGKVAKSAVLRNTLKRRAYEAIRNQTPRVSKGYSCVFYFKKGEKPSFREIQREIAALLKEGRLVE